MAHFYDPFPSDDVQAKIKSRDFDSVHRVCDSYLLSPQISENDKKLAYHFKGMCFYLQNQISKSIDAFKKALQVDPRFTDSAVSLSILYNDIGKYDEAKRIYDSVHSATTSKRMTSDPQLDRKFALKHIELGDLYFKYHRYDEASDEYSKSLRLDPKNQDYRLKLARTYAKKGYSTRALQELKQLCLEHEKYLPARIHLGLLYYSLGNIIDAQIEWEKALKLDPHNKEISSYLKMIQGASETRV